MKVKNPANLTKTLLCFDFDGTIFGHTHSPPLSIEFNQCLSFLVESGAKWGINTGRSFAHLLEGISQCDFDVQPDFIVAREREVYIYDDQKDDFVVDETWRESCLLCHQEMLEEQSLWLNSIKHFVNNETEAEWISEPGDPAGIIASSIDEMDAIVSFIEGSLSFKRTIEYLRSTIYLRFTHPDFHKGTSLARVAAKYKISKENIFAVGDGQNDLGMLNSVYCGMIACPSNAVELVQKSVRSQGGFVSAQEVSLGVVEALRSYFSILQVNPR